ncbi:MAG TPA: protein kinase, partial [Vicinamibacteria bacterium]|nr:protein kinase [Vicinamibacteria bacterium]
GAVTAYTTKSGLSDDRVSALHEDAEGTLWIGTSGGGLVRHRQGRFTPITSAAGLHDDRLFQILEDGEGHLWMSSNRGVFRVRKKDLEAFAAGSLPRVHTVSYGVADGMRSAECSGGNQPAGWKARDGRLWFPTIKGVVVVDPARIRVNTVPPPVVVEEVTVDGAPADLRAEAALVAPPGRRKLDLRYTALTFPAPERVRFRYRLEGFDPDWVEAGTERVARYTSLPPGAYTFRVKARNADGVWNEAGAAVRLQLQPFFYETRAFQAASGIALVLVGIAIQRLRMRRLQARARELERIVAEQTRDLRDANEALQRAQEQLARLSEANPEKIENVASWGAAMAREVGAAIRARGVHLFRVDGAELVPITENAVRPPTLDAVQALRGTVGAPANGTAIVPVTGLTDELRGAIVVEGARNWGDTERRLVGALAQHLGSTLDLRQIREQLTNTEVRQAQVRQQMQARGVHMLKVCPRCGRCYDDTPERCVADDLRLDATRLLPYKVLDRYRLSFLLGEGGNGIVFEAHDEKLQRDVALKVIRAEILSDPGARFRLEREARALARIKHPSVIALFDSGELADGSAFLVMELLRGRDLADLIRHAPGTPPQVATVLRQVSRALKAAHDVGVVHRDVKPGNIFLVRDGDGFRCKVVDFGLAKWAGAEARLTQSGMLVGTPAYMSPEQVEGNNVDHRTDIYSLATVAYESLTGRPVVPGREVARMLVDVLYGTPPRVVSLIPEVPSAVDDALAAALSKKPEDRPSDIETWADGLAALLDGARGDLDSGWPLKLLERPRPGQESAGPRRSEPTL